MSQALVHKRIAVRMDLVGRVADFDAGAGKSALGKARQQRQVELSQGWAVKDLERARIVPIQLRHPEINVLIVVQLNVPGKSLASFRPEKAVRKNTREKRVGGARHVMACTEICAHGHPL